jgi:hypothetical protein
MKFLRLLSVLCTGLCVLCALKATALDREAFTFTNYDLHLRVEPEQQRLGVRGTVTVRNDSQSPQKNLSLQISSTLNWRSIQIDGKPAQFVAQPYTSDIDHTGSLSEAVVTLPKEILPSSSLTLEIGYEGTVPLDATRLTRIGVPEAQAKHSDWDQIGTSFTAVRGVGYVVWYPVSMEAANLSEGNSLFEAFGRWKQKDAASTFKMSIATPPLESEVRAPLLLCSGEILSFVTRGGSPQFPGAQCQHAPLGSLTPFFIAANYDVLNRDSITIFHLPDHSAGAQSYALATDLAVPFVKDWFGVPQQKPKVVELADSVAAPFEDGVTLLTSLAREDTRLYQLSAVHQLVHAALNSPRLWISEGLAHFAQAAYLNQQNGREGTLQFMSSHAGAVLAAEKISDSESTAARESLINTNREEFYRSKAMYVWWMLRDMIGEDTLKKALSSYRADQDHAPSYVQKLIAAQTSRDLEWFFDDWVYRDKGLPDFHIESANPRPLVGGGYVIAITVDNLGTAGAEVPVTAKLDEGFVTKRLEVRAKSKATVRIEIPSAAKEIVVNDGSVPESDSGNNSFTIK